MRYNENRAEIVGKKILKPGDGVNVKTVCRLIEQNDIGRTEKRLRQEDLDLFTFFQLAHRQIKIVFGES